MSHNYLQINLLTIISLVSNKNFEPFFKVALHNY